MPSRPFSENRVHLLRAPPYSHSSAPQVCLILETSPPEYRQGRPARRSSYYGRKRVAKTTKAYRRSALVTTRPPRDGVSP